jgi:hypothetical protein
VGVFIICVVYLAHKLISSDFHFVPVSDSRQRQEERAQGREDSAEGVRLES